MNRFFYIFMLLVGALLLTVATVSISPPRAIAAQHYIAKNSPYPTYPFTDPDSAAHTIQEAINAARDFGGGTVDILDTETYNENITLFNNVFVAGKCYGEMECDFLPKIIGSGGVQPIVTADSIQNAGIHCVWVKNGTAPNGGGIYVINSTDISVLMCCISNNIATSNGGGIYFKNSSGSIIENRIFNDSSSTNGGGIYFENSSGSISNNRIFNNRAVNGAGIACDSGATPTITVNKIGVDGTNRASENGGGIWCSGAGTNPTIGDTLEGEGNTIENNEAANGGGISVEDNASPTINGDKIKQNQATTAGGGIHSRTKNLHIEDCIIEECRASVEGAEVFSKVFEGGVFRFLDNVVFNTARLEMVFDTETDSKVELEVNELTGARAHLIYRGSERLVDFINNTFNVDSSRIEIEAGATKSWWSDANKYYGKLDLQVGGTKFKARCEGDTINGDFHADVNVSGEIDVDNTGINFLDSVKIRYQAGAQVGLRESFCRYFGNVEVDFGGEGQLFAEYENDTSTGTMWSLGGKIDLGLISNDLKHVRIGPGYQRIQSEGNWYGEIEIPLSRGASVVLFIGDRIGNRFNFVGDEEFFKKTSVAVSASPIVRITGCMFQTDTGIGLRLENIPSILIDQNHFVDNAIGLLSISSNPTVIYNNFSNNSLSVQNTDPLVFIDAKYNWWGDSTGPYDPSPGPPDLNTEGQGDSISDYVNYRPWFARSITEPMALGVPVNSKWNMVSVPLTVGDYRKSVLFPATTSRAFAYEGTYVPKDTLENRRGYWLKFPSPDTVALVGFPIVADTANVVEGWNMIGSLSVPVPVSTIISDPAGMVTSEIYGYEKKYITADTIHPGKAYWIKVKDTCKLVMSPGTSSGTRSKSAIQIIPTSELPPPPPPDGDVNIEPARGGQASNIPTEYALEQNYPNPFNPTTDVRYAIPASPAGECDVSYVSLKVYDVLGREVATLVDEVKDPGFYSVRWDASGVPSGIYFYRMTAGTFTDMKKLMLLR